MAICMTCDTTMVTGGSCTVEPYIVGLRGLERVRYGQEISEGRTNASGPCPDCGVHVGAVHHHGPFPRQCDVEECPNCHLQVLGVCECREGRGLLHLGDWAAFRRSLGTVLVLLDHDAWLRVSDERTKGFLQFARSQHGELVAEAGADEYLSADHRPVSDIAQDLTALGWAVTPEYAGMRRLASSEGSLQEHDIADHAAVAFQRGYGVASPSDLVVEADRVDVEVIGRLEVR